MTILKKVITLIIIFALSTGGLNVTVYASSDLQSTSLSRHKQWGQTSCPGLNTCYGCSASNCKVYKVQKLSQTFTLSQCKAIANRASKISSWSSYVSIVAGYKAPITSALLALYGMGVANNYKMFEYAAVKGRGIKLSYEYVIHKTSYSLNKYRKGTWAYY